jgi:hypothetical protein
VERSAGRVVVGHSHVWKAWRLAGEGYSFFLSAHSHTCGAFFSDIDNAHDYRIAANVLDFCPNYIRLVSGTDGIVAEVYSREEPEWLPLDGIKVVGPSGFRFITPKNAPAPYRDSGVDLTVHDRTLRMGTGSETDLRLIRNSVIGVIGVGGGNSAVNQILKHLQPGKVILIEPDHIERHNANRLFGYREGDEGKPKAIIAKREIHALHPEIEVECILDHFPSARTVDPLKEADILISFPDNNPTRDQLALFGARYHKPVFDAGTSITYRDREEPHRISARVLTQFPGGPCLRCLGVKGGYSPVILEETRKAQASYSNRPDLQPVPQIVTTNAFAATLIVRNLLCWLYPGLVESIPTYLQFEELAPSLEDLSGLFPRKPDCPYCGDHFEAERGWGDVSPSRNLIHQSGEVLSEEAMTSR